jgi:hypothetical protein
MSRCPGHPGPPGALPAIVGSHTLPHSAIPCYTLPFPGSGASPEGNRPFLDVLDLETKETRRIWQSQPPYYEYTSSILSDPEEPISLDNLQMLASRCVVCGWHPATRLV